MSPINIVHPIMTSSPAHSKWSRPLPEDRGYESPTIGIRIEGPEGAEVAMQVSLDGVQTVDGHAEQYPSQEGPLNPLFDDNAHLVNWGDRHSLGIWNRSPASSPPCSPPPSSGSNTPESGYLSGDYLSSPENRHTFQELGGTELDLEDRLFEREQHIPGLLLQETIPDIFTPGVFSEEELHFLNSSSIVDQNSSSPQALSLDIPPLTPPSGSISEPAPSTSNRPKRKHHRRRSERVLLPENPPLTRRNLRSARRASSSSPYPSPHSSPSSREPIFLPQSRSSSNSTLQSMDDNRAVDQAVYRHASSSAPSLVPSPRGTHASPHTASYSPEHRPQSPSLVHRTLAREGRRKSRSISPFDNGASHHGHRPRSSSRTRPDVFAQTVPPYLTKSKNAGGSGAGASNSVPAGTSSSVLHKSYPLRMANFETGRQQQPVVQAGGVQRPSSLVRTSYLPDDDMSSSSNEDAEMEDEAVQQGHEGSRSRRRSVTPASSSDDESLPPPLPPKSSSAAHRISAGNEKGKTTRGFDEGADGMPVDARACEPVAPDTDDPGSEDEIDAEEDYRRSRRSQDDLSSQRRSSYPSVHHHSHHYTTSYPSTYNGISAHGPSSLREEVSQPRTRSHSHSPSRQDRSRSLSRSRVRYSPMATRVTTTSQSNESRPSSCPRPPAAGDHTVRTRRSTRLSKSPARPSVGDAGHVHERLADQRYLHCCCGFTAQSRADLHSHLKRSNGDCREVFYREGGSQQARAPKVSPTRLAGSRRRNSDASTSYNNYQSQRPRDREAEEEDDGADSEFEGDVEDGDYETGSQRGRRGKKRTSPSRGSYNYHGGTQPLQGSPLKRSAVLLSPHSPDTESKPPIGQLQPSPRSYPTHSRSASDSNVRARPSAYHNTVTQGSPSNRSPNHNHPPLHAAPFSDASTDSHNGISAPAGGTIVNGVGAMSPNRNQYRSVGSRNIDNASEKRRKGEKRFKCKFEDCGKMFTTNQNCQIHERKHVGDAPYRCGCGYAVAGRSDLVRHLKKKNVNPECKELARDDPRRVVPLT